MCVYVCVCVCVGAVWYVCIGVLCVGVCVWIDRVVTGIG